MQNLIQQHKRDILGIRHGLERFHYYCLTHEASVINRSHITGGNLQEGHDNPLTQAIKNPTMHTLIQHKDPIQAGTPATYS